jgi:hypothetical protein
LNELSEIYKYKHREKFVNWRRLQNGFAISKIKVEARY